MNITIGLVSRCEDINNIQMEIIPKNNLKYLHNKCNYIGILNYDNSILDTNLLKLCDGIIICGGSDIYPYHFKIVEYCINNNIPVLGICMGHQILGLFSNNKENDKDLIKVNNHNIKEKHTINIKENSILYKIFGPTIDVNSRHIEALQKVSMPFKVTALSNDNVIEAIEYIDDNHFLLGLQFHPEDMDNTENLYNYFIKAILKRKNITK